MIYICHKSHHCTSRFDGGEEESQVVSVGTRAKLIGAGRTTTHLQPVGDAHLTLIVAQGSFDTCWTQCPEPQTTKAMQKLPVRRGRGKNNLKGGLDQ